MIISNEPFAASKGTPVTPWINMGAPETGIDTAKAEELYGVTYIGDFCLRTSLGGWSEAPAAVFYQPNPPQPHYSNYMGLFVRQESVFVTNAKSVAEGEWYGAMAESGEIIFSRFRHDYRVSQDGTAMVDGGRDYARMYGGRSVILKVIGPRMRIVELE